LSATRRHRRRIARARVEAHFDAGADAPDVTIGTAGRYDVVKRGSALFVVPGDRADFDDQTRAALSARRAATLTGRCPLCGARRRVHTVSGMARVVFAHDPDCVAGDAQLGELLGRAR
jgi:hypothetical protein